MSESTEKGIIPLCCSLPTIMPGCTLNFSAYILITSGAKLPFFIISSSFVCGSRMCDAKASASSSLSFCLHASESSRKISFFPCRSMWPISWKKVNQNTSFLFCLPVICTHGIPEIHLVEPLIGAFGRHCVYISLMPTLAHTSCNSAPNPSGCFAQIFFILGIASRSDLLENFDTFISAACISPRLSHADIA